MQLYRYYRINARLNNFGVIHSEILYILFLGDCSEDCDVNADCIGDRCVCRPGYFGDGNSCLSEIVF